MTEIAWATVGQREMALGNALTVVGNAPETGWATLGQRWATGWATLLYTTYMCDAAAFGGWHRRCYAHSSHALLTAIITDTVSLGSLRGCGRRGER